MNTVAYFAESIPSFNFFPADRVLTPTISLGVYCKRASLERKATKEKIKKGIDEYIDVNVERFIPLAFTSQYNNVPQPK
jgi:hypothetical protein